MPILTVLLLCLALGALQPGRALPLTDDSTTFADYWALVDRGGDLAAARLISGLDSAKRDCTGLMVNFLLAWRSYSSGDYSGVSIHLDRGVPADLRDYALWMRGDALTRSSFPDAARKVWSELAADSESVWQSEALFQWAILSSKSGDMDRFYALENQLSRKSLGREQRQQLAELAGQALARANRHEEAAQRFWGGYVEGPLKDTGRRLRRLLDTYKWQFGVTPRAENASELRRELAALEQDREFSFGLKRIASEAPLVSTDAQRELLSYYKGRFQHGLGHHREAISALELFLQDFPASPLRPQALYYLGRSAYLIDNDSTAIHALTRIGSDSTAVEWAAKAWDLLATLYIDRHRMPEAVDASRRWAALSEQNGSRADCLWRLGRALWENGQYAEADSTWQILAGISNGSDYGPASLYWSSRAARLAADSLHSAEMLRTLKSRYPYSYYSVFDSSTLSPVPDTRPLIAPGLDYMWESGGEHSRKFAMLAALHIPELALKEWPRAAREQNGDDGFIWWKAQLHLWSGDRMSAWKVILVDLGSYLRSAGPRPPDFYPVAYPLNYQTQIARLARKYNLDPFFIFGLICQESHYDAGAVSPVGAYGLMQLMPATARLEARKLKKPYKKNKLRDPDYNLELGISHVSSLFEELNGNPILVLAAYNAGVAAARSWEAEFGVQDTALFIERIPYRETRLFIKRNIEHRAAYRRLYPDAAVLPQ